jgi:predicted metal-dependent HD superfamily phosphohydrolase
MLFEKAKKFILNKLTKELPDHLTYHSVGHIRDVFAAATILAKEEGVTGEDATLLLTAVLFHDSGFTINADEHEKNSCKLAKQHLPEYGYTPAQLKRICAMIMATKIPQNPKNLLEQIICDADLDYLGRDDFFVIGNKLYDELRVAGLVKTEKEWNKLQVRFLTKHRYFTSSAIRLRDATKAAHLKTIKAIIKK